MAELHPDAARLLDEKIAEHRLERVAGYIRERAAPCYAVIASGADDYAAEGNSRLGGLPDLPDGAEWPTTTTAWGERKACAAAFFGQVNFAEIPPLGPPSPLPSSGLMHLFVDYIESAGDPVPLSASLTPHGVSLSRRGPPAGFGICDEYLDGLNPVRIRFVPWISLPHNDDAFGAHIEAEGGVADGRDAFSRRIDLDQSLRHPSQIGQLLGYANTGDERENLYREVQLTRMGRREMVYADYWDSMEAYEKTLQESAGTPFLESQEKMRPRVEWLMAHQAEITAGAAEWRLLLQVESNREMSLLINDADPIYVFVRHDDLSRGDFSDLAGEVTQG